jgi:Ulp1 family protease
MTTLNEKGPKAVASWTGKKNINLFQKKLVFIPVHTDLNWLLCIVVNPGKVKNWYDQDVGGNEEHSL